MLKLFRRILYLARAVVGHVVFYLFGGVTYARMMGVKIGDGCRIYTRRFGSEPFLITIGNRVTITSGVVFLTHDGSMWLFRDADGRRYDYRPIEIGNDVFIGVNSILLPGVRVGSRVVVGAGSVVTRSVPEGMVVAGTPARVVGKYEEFKKVSLEARTREDDFPAGASYRDRIEAAVRREFREELPEERE